MTERRAAVPQGAQIAPFGAAKSRSSSIRWQNVANPMERPCLGELWSALTEYRR